MEPIIPVYDLKDESGKTIKEKNLEKKHSIPLGALVEVVLEDSIYDQEDYHYNGLRLFVVQHSRDCDGTPLYSLSFNKKADVSLREVERDLESVKKGSFDHHVLTLDRQGYLGSLLTGFSEESLKTIKLPE